MKSYTVHTHVLSLELKTRQHINDVTEVEKKLHNMVNTQTCNIEKEQLKMTKDMVHYQCNVKLMDH